MFSLETMKEAVVFGKRMIKSNLDMAHYSHKLGNKIEEDKYFSEASKLNTKVISLEAQINIIQSSVN
jgi:hypothetical protein